MSCRTFFSREDQLALLDSFVCSGLVDWIYFCIRLPAHHRNSVNMASDRDVQSDDLPRQLRGFRRRWQPLDEPSESGALGSAADIFGTDETFDDALHEGSETCFDVDAPFTDWELLSDHPPAVFLHEGLNG